MANAETTRSGKDPAVADMGTRMDVRCASMWTTPTRSRLRKFHLAQNSEQAGDDVRRKENKALRAAGDDRLKGTRYDWLRIRRIDPEDAGPCCLTPEAN